MKKNVGSFLLIATTFFLGIFLTIGLYVVLTRKHIEIITPLPLSQFSLAKPPSQSLVGHITKMSGVVLWQSRVSPSPVPITNTQNIQQGEEIDTMNGVTSVSFDKILTLNLSNNSTVAIIQSLPANIVLEQKEGVVTYQKLDSSIPVSIRGLDLLINIQNGNCTLTVHKDTSNVILEQTNGESVIAFTDINNTSTVKTVQKGQKFVFNNNTKTFVLIP